MKANPLLNILLLSIACSAVLHPPNYVNAQTTDVDKELYQLGRVLPVLTLSSLALEECDLVPSETIRFGSSSVRWINDKGTELLQKNIDLCERKKSYLINEIKIKNSIEFNKIEKKIFLNDKKMKSYLERLRLDIIMTDTDKYHRDALFCDTLYSSVNNAEDVCQ